MFLIEFLTRNSPYLLNLSLLTAPLTAFSIWFYDEKKRPRTISTIYLFGFLFVGISVALMMGINSQYPSERGFLGLTIGLCISVFLFGLLLKFWYRLSWPSTLLAAWMPISYFSYFFFISNYL